MTSVPKVSIIIPVYNVERLLRSCLQSAVNQTLRDIQIICIDDKSTDRSLSVLKEYAQKDSRIILLEQAVNQGQGAARNRGLAVATGEYIMFLDADDWYEPTACEDAYNHISQHKNDLCLFGSYFVEPNRRFVYMKMANAYANATLPINFKELETNFITNMASWPYIYNRQFLQTNHILYPNDRIGEDVGFMAQVYIQAKSFSVLYKPLYNYRMLPPPQKEKGSSMDISRWKDLFGVRERGLEIIAKASCANLTNAYLAYCVRSILYWGKAFSSQNPAIRQDYYKKTVEFFLKLSKKYDLSSAEKENPLVTKIIKNPWPYWQRNRYINKLFPLPKKAKLATHKKTFLEKIFSLKRSADRSAKILTILGFKFIVKHYCVEKNYQRVLRSLRRAQKIKVIFLVNELAKWKAQSLYELMDKSTRFEPVIALTIREDRLAEPHQKEFLHTAYKYFVSRGMRCVYAYDFERMQPIPLSKFQARVVFFQQPWGIPHNQRPVPVSKYALTCYIPYYVPNYGGLELDCLPYFHNDLFRYYVLNQNWADLYAKKMSSGHKNLVAVGHTMLDYYYLHKNTPHTQDYVIYAPHWSITHPQNPNKENYATFLHNGKEILAFAQQHPEVNWAFKPHPRLKKALRNIGWTEQQINDYYSAWEKIATCCYDASYMDIFVNSKAMITDCGSFLIEYFCSGKPLIHLISSSILIVPQPFVNEIFDTFYQARSLSQLQQLLTDVVLKGKDPKRQERHLILKKQGLLNNFAAQRTLDDLTNAI